MIRFKKRLTILTLLLIDGETNTDCPSKNNAKTENNVLIDLEDQIHSMKDGTKTFTILLDDPASNSYLQVFKDVHIYG